MNLNAWLTVGLGAIQAVATVVLVWVTVRYVKLTGKMADAAAAETVARRSAGQLDALRALAGACVDLIDALTSLRISVYQSRTWPESRGVIEKSGEIRAIQSMVARREAEIPESMARQWHVLQSTVTHLQLGSAKLALIAGEYRRENPEAVWDDLADEYKKFREAGEVEWELLESGEASDSVIESLRSFRLDIQSEIRAISGM